MKKRIVVLMLLFAMSMLPFFAAGANPAMEGVRVQFVRCGAYGVEESYCQRSWYVCDFFI